MLGLGTTQSLYLVLVTYSVLGTYTYFSFAGIFEVYWVRHYKCDFAFIGQHVIYNFGLNYEYIILVISSKIS